MTAASPITTLLFDLDGTLLDVDMHQFVPAYLNYLAQCIDAELDREFFVQTMIERTMQRLHSDDGSQTNEAFFLAAAELDFRISALQFRAGLQCFCDQYLPRLQPLVRSLPIIREMMHYCQALGYEVVIATNPVFPRAVVDARLQWADLGDFDYRWITSSENSCYCKPNPNYFLSLLGTLQRTPQQCLMIGNDTVHDLSASELGIRTFLVDTWLIDRGSRYRADHRGSHHDLYTFLEQLAAPGA